MVDSTLAVPNYRVGNFRFFKNNNNLSFLKIFEKNHKNVLSRKLQRTEQSYLEDRFSIFEITLTTPTTGFGISNFAKIN